jgi:hypothetical protein
MWSALLALLQAIPGITHLLDKLIPTRDERSTSKVRQEKQRERNAIDDWMDRGSGPSA